MQVFHTRTLISILADLNIVVWMVSACPLVSNYSISLTKLLGIIQVYQLQLVSLLPSYSIAFFNSLAKFKYFSLFFVFFDFHSAVHQDYKVHYLTSSLFLLIITRVGFLARIIWSNWILKSPRILCVSFSRTDSVINFVVWSNFNFLHNS